MSEKLSTPHHDLQQAAPVELQIIGGGLGGLIAANLAVDAGLSVRLIEKQRSVGGRAGSSANDGYTLNQGPHALYLSGELRAILKQLDIQPTGSPPPLAGAVGTIAGTTAVMPQGLVTMLKTSLIPGRGKRQLAAFMARLPRMKPAPLASVTVADWLDDVTDVPELRALLSGLINLSTYNAAADLASAGAALVQLQMAMADGVIYLDGGWASIVDALDARLIAARASGQLECVTAGATEIRSPERQPGRTGGRSFEGSLQTTITPEAAYPAANTLVAAGSPALADRLLGGAGLEAAAGPPVQASVMDIGVRGEPEVGVHLGLDSGLYYATHSVAERLAPTGHSLISLARYVPPGGELPVGESKSLLLAHAEAVGITPDKIAMSRYLHKLTVAWGMPLAVRGGLAGRPTPAVANRPGVYIAGDWVGDTGLLADASAASASAAVRTIVADSRRRTAAMVAT